MHGFRKSPTEMHAWRTSGTLAKHLRQDIAEELIAPVQEGSDVWYWFFRNVDVFRPPVPSVFPEASTARGRYTNLDEMPPRILDSMACMRDAVRLNIIPKNPNTLADYGFTRTDQRNHGMLLAVYTVLFMEKDLYPSDILLLCDAGILKNIIVTKMHSPLPQVTPPRVLKWFDNHSDIFDDDKPVSLWVVRSAGSGASGI
ncbi:hypothetical protein B0H16DRAFT_183380 [Mycena metata]|uniref:Uncharacterized protein n=1 Tax=Mycena metata TaxID=1033252 RepID=A0AAD7MSZ2_9AGAR|nr:hypothetical protein B0H16DRAFT_183380 [Mycena metata]